MVAFGPGNCRSSNILLGLSMIGVNIVAATGTDKCRISNISLCQILRPFNWELKVV